MLESYYRINEAIGISINLLQDGNALVSACSISINNNRLDLTKKITNIFPIEDLTKEFSAKSYLAINLSGKGVLQKQIPKMEEINPHNFAQLLPNANFADFYIQNFVSGDESFVSIIRKAEADKWVDFLKKLGFIPLMLSLGPFPVQNIISQLNIYDNNFQFHGHIIQRNEKKQWTSYQYSELISTLFPLKIESEAIQETIIVPYSVAFQLVLAAKLPVIKAEVPLLETVNQKVISDKKFQVKGFLILSVFFILLLANFLVFSLLNSSNIRLADQVSKSAQNTNDIQTIGEQVKGKEALLKDLGWDGGINKSVLIDRLAVLLPKEVLWKEIVVNPADPVTNHIQKSLNFMDRKIRIIGSSEKIISVNEWIARVKTQKWVKNIQLDSYIYNNELNTGQFTVLIDY